MVGNHYFIVTRMKKSYDFKKVKDAEDSWDGDNNAQNNMIDVGRLYEGGTLVWEGPMQTVANMPGCRHADTLVPGRGLVRWNVPKNNFYGPVHGIVGLADQDGQIVNHDSIEAIPGPHGEPVDTLRWIFAHSTLKSKPNGDGVELTRFAWSAGCFITTPAKQDELYVVGTHKGFVDGDEIPLVLEEETGINEVSPISLAVANEIETASVSVVEEATQKGSDSEAEAPTTEQAPEVITDTTEKTSEISEGEKP